MDKLLVEQGIEENAEAFLEGTLGTSEFKGIIKDLPDDLKISESEIQLGEPIGGGGFGTVYKSKWKRDGRDVAVKVITAWDAVNRGVLLVEREVKILASVDHPAVMSLGAFVPPISKLRRPMIVLQYMANKSVSNWIGKATPQLSMTQKYIILYGVAEGMKYLHAANIIHRDVKPENVLLDDNMYPKITDFGLAKVMQGGTVQQSIFETTKIYIAPEMMTQDTHYTNAVDVYAFGVMMFYILAESPPFNRDNSLYTHCRLVLHGVRPKIPALICPELGNLIKECWNGAPVKRPSFEEIVEYMRSPEVLRQAGVNVEKFEAYCRFLESRDTFREDVSDDLDPMDFSITQPLLTNVLRNQADDGDTNAQLQYAMNMKNGMYGATGKDQKDDVKKYLEMAMKGGSIDAKVALGDCYSERYFDDIKPRTSWKLAAQLYREASEEGSIDAKVKRAICHHKGRGVAIRDEKTAVGPFRECAEKEHPLAEMWYAIYLEEGLGGLDVNLKKAMEYYQRASDHAHPKAMYRFGLFLLNGNTVECNVDKAISMFQLAVGHCYYNAYFPLTEIFLHEKEDVDMARFYAKEGAEKGVFACMVEYGFIPGHDKALAAKYLESARDASFSTKQRKFASNCETGVIGPKNIAKAIEYYKLAAANGDSKAKIALANCILANGIKEGRTEALETLRTSKNSTAVFLYGRILKKGLYGVPKDVDKALEVWNTKSDGMCRYESGRIYEERMDWSQAKARYQDAINSGHPEAMVAAGKLYENALGVNMDLAQAMTLYRSAALRGYRAGLMKLLELQKQYPPAQGAYSEVLGNFPKK